MKKELREKYLKLRDEIPIKKRIEDSEEITSRLLDIDSYRRAHTVMTYVSVGSEVCTYPLIQRMLSDKKRVCVPVCTKESLTITPHAIESLDDLKIGAYRIPENEAGAKIDIDKIDLIIVPGCVMGRNMHRIGYGKGYYDRFLRRAKADTVGLCYDCCLLESVSYGADDVPLKYIITQSEILHRA